MAKSNLEKDKDVLQDPGMILKGPEEYYQKNKKLITYILGGLGLVVAAFLFYKYQSNENNKEAQASMYKAVFAWEKDSLKKAMDGDEGLVTISEDYSGTDAGNLANYYAGVAYLKQGKYQEAVDKLKEFNSNDLLLQGLVYSLLGDAYLELKDNDNAIENYRKAVDYKPNDSFTPKYLMKLALAYEVNKDYQSAIEAYTKVIENYPSNPILNDAKKYKGRAEGLNSSKTEK